MAMNKISVVKSGKLVNIDFNARAKTLEFVRLEIGWNKWFRAYDFADYSITFKISRNTVFKRLEWLWRRKWLKSQKKGNKRYFMLPSETNKGEWSKAQNYFKTYYSFTAPEGYLIKRSE